MAAAALRNDGVVWGQGAEARASQAPRCSTGDKKQLAALVALRSLDPDAVSTAVTRPASGAPAPPPPETLLAAAAGDATGDCVPPGKLTPPPARDATGGRVLDVAIAICGDANAGRRRDRGGREMTRDEIDQLKKRVVGRAVTWGSPGNASSGVVEDVTLVGADSLRLSGFSGLDVTVATYYRLQGDGERWGVRAAAKHLGHDDDRARGAPGPLVRGRRYHLVPRRAADAEAEGAGQRARRARVARRRLGRGAMCVSCTVPGILAKKATYTYAR